jgi:hypothetical protein
MRPVPQRGRTWWLAFMLLCVLATQTLGVLHGFAHANTHRGNSPQGTAAAVTAAPDLHHPHPVRAGANADAHADSDARETARGMPHARSALDHLFAPHEDAGDCRLFDALGQQPGGVMAGPTYPPVKPPNMHRLRRLEGAFVARWATLFDARGPPLSH